ncbi:MAG TPA: hypothetical protein P5123_02620 [Spirochaetota bacterium]|nr:hypothetical protein [Spirochaetota bacterium]
MIDTTICIKPELLSKLEKFALENGMKTVDYALLLLNKLVNSKIYQDLSKKKAVAYQPRCTDGILLKMHIYPDDNFYEILLDSRKIFKCSVSYLLAFAIEEHDCLVDSEKDSKNYTILKVIVCNIPVLIISWGDVSCHKDIVKAIENFEDG